MRNSNKVKITNSALFRAMRWLVDNTEDITMDALDTMNSREIMDTYIMRSATFTVEYSVGGRMLVWKGGTYDAAVRRVAAVIERGHRPEVWRESDRKCVTLAFDPSWV